MEINYINMVLLCVKYHIKSKISLSVLFFPNSVVTRIMILGLRQAEKRLWLKNKIMPFPKALFVVPNRSYKELNNHKIHENDLDKLSELVHEK